VDEVDGKGVDRADVRECCWELGYPLVYLETSEGGRDV
jgi:hypothetical protein